MKQYLFSAALATTLLATSCSDNDMAEPITPDGQKEMISFSMGMGDDTPAMAKRAARASYGFEKETRILMRIQSDDNVDANGNHRYTKTLATAGKRGANPSTGDDKQFSTVTPIGGAYNRYWDDAFGRNAHLSIFAVAIPNRNTDGIWKSDGTGQWNENALQGKADGWDETSDNNQIQWTVASTQTATTLEDEDLVYSRNIRKGAGADEAGRYVWDFTKGDYVPNIVQAITGTNVFKADRMRFTLSDNEDPTSPGKFDRGHLIFNHALSRLTITIKSGEGFIKSGEDFDANNNFKLSDEGVQALGMKTSGTLDVSTGLWADGATTGTITTNPTVEGPTGSKTYASYKTFMQMLPGYKFVKDDPTNVLKFTIDNNEYYITKGLIHQALRKNHANNGLTDTDDPYTMEQGKNYVLTITVNKTKIESLTATLADWVDVEAAKEELDNSYVKLSLKDTEGKACEEDFDLYRLGVGDGNIHTSETGTTADAYKYEWFGNYKDKASLSKAADYETSKNWTTEWYFEDNKTFYHFRTVNKDTEILGDEDDTKDYFAIHDGAVANTDPHWGAPLNNKFTGTAASKYNIAEGDDEGYTDIIYQAIGSTKDAIAIQEFHMLSEIRVIVKTKSEAEGGVKLKDGDVYTTVTLYQFAQNGQVKMGNGFVTAQAPFTHSQALTQPTDFFKTNPTVTNAFTWRVVPQTLSRGDNKTDKVAIKIQTPDNNLYYCIEDLSTITPQGSSNPINYWLPNHRYTYTFIISKKGIDQITCTVADWIDVKAADKDITLED
ncbi:MAG: fimbrillin family protein [Bacteroidales bacterium]|nr:fimbrillin family protein [Bacteroidales bacterium]